MSELNAFTFGLGQYAEDCSPCVVAFDGERKPRLASDKKFYLKSEADKVIAELEESHKKEVGQLLLEIVKLKEHVNSLILDNYLKDKEIRRQKYKRCMNNAWWCYREEFYAEDCHCERWVDWAIKWWKRWLAIAEKFKQESTAQ